MIKIYNYKKNQFENIDTKIAPHNHERNHSFNCAWLNKPISIRILLYKYLTKQIEYPNFETENTLRKYGITFTRGYAMTLKVAKEYKEFKTQTEILETYPDIERHKLEDYLRCNREGWEFWYANGKWWGLKGWDKKIYMAKDKEWLAEEMKIDIHYITSFVWFDTRKIVIEQFTDWSLD